MGWLRVRVSNCFRSCFNQYEFIVKVVVIMELFNVNVIMEVFIVSVIMEVLNVIMEVFNVSVIMEEFIIIVIAILVILIDWYGYWSLILSQ